MTDNTNSERSNDCIYTRPCGNLQGGFFVYDLKTLECTHQNFGSNVPMPESVIKLVEDITRKQRCPDRLVFTSRDGTHTILYIANPLSDMLVNADSAYQHSDTSSVYTSLTGVVSTLSGRSSDCEISRENDCKNQKSNCRICNNFYNLRSSCTVSSSESNESTKSNESNKSPVHDESNGLINSNESNESRGSSHKLSNESNKSFHLTRSTGTNTHHSHEEDKISDSGSTNTNGTNSNKVVESCVVQRPGLRPVVQSTHNKFGKSDGFKETTHT